jgi:hypothetical protein
MLFRYIAGQPHHRPAPHLSTTNHRFVSLMIGRSPPPLTITRIISRTSPLPTRVIRNIILSINKLLTTPSITRELPNTIH